MKSVETPTIEKTAKPAGGRAPLQAFVADAKTQHALQECLEQLGQSGGEIHRGGIATAIERLTNERSPNALIVDISGIDLPVSKLHDLAEVCEPGVTVIAIGERDEIGLYRDLLHAGVSDYIVKPLTPQILGKALSAHGEPGRMAPISQKLGKVLAFIGARGGVGTTTIASNLAWYLANQMGRRVALVDLDLQNGDCGLALGVKPTAGLEDALLNPHRIDATLVDRAMTRVGERLFVLSSQDRLEEEVHFSAEAVEALIDVLRAQFHYVLIDVPRIAERPYRKALDLADLRVVVADQTVRAVRDTARLRASFGEGGAQHRNVLVVNRSGEGGRHAVTLDEMKNVLELQAKTVIPFQPTLFTTAASRGEVAVARRGKFTDAIADLAGELSGRPPARRRWGGFS